jgi:peroxin-2
MPSSSFAVAHEKILARRRVRAASSTLPIQQSSTFISPALAARLPHPLRNTLASFSTTLTPALSRAGTSPSFRVSQLDSSLLDNELLDLFKSQVSDALKYYSPHLLDDYTDEITLFLRAVVFKLTVWDHGASYGASLQNLWYTDARSIRPARPKKWQKGLLGVLSVGGPYMWQKWQDRLLTLSEPNDYRDEEPPSRYTALLTRLTSLATTAASLATFASFALFLLTGKYATPLDRLLRLRLTPKSTVPVSRDVSFEYLNRQLVWHAITEFLLFLLPLVGISRWRRWVGRAWRRAQQGLTKLRGGEEEDTNNKKKEGVLGFLPERTCAICYSDQNGTSVSNVDGTSAGAMAGSGSGIIGSAQTDITNPYETIPCGCVYCFVCLAQRLEAQDGEEWTCLRCGEGVTACRPWRGDVLDVVEEDAEVGVTAATNMTGEKAYGAVDYGEKKMGYRSPSSSPRSSMSKGSKPSSPAKSVSFAVSVIDN